MSDASIGTDMPGFMLFDGSSDGVSVANDASLNFGSSTSFTIEVWIDLDSEDDNETIVSKVNGYWGMGYELRIEGGSDYGMQPHIEQADGDQYRGIQSPANLSLNTRYHSVCVYDRSQTNTTIYTNSNSSSPGNYNEALSAIGDIDVSNVLYIGRDIAGHYADGNIDVVRIYNRSLSAKEVSQNFNAQRSRFGV